MTKEFLLHKDKKKRTPSHGQAHLVFADTQNQLLKTKRACPFPTHASRVVILILIL